jgi:hypothetical protein
MPFKSRAQQKWAFANDMPWAHEWASKTNFKKLPKRKKRVRKAMNDPFNINKFQPPSHKTRRNILGVEAGGFGATAAYQGAKAYRLKKLSGDYAGHAHGFGQQATELSGMRHHFEAGAARASQFAAGEKAGKLLTESRRAGKFGVAAGVIGTALGAAAIHQNRKIKKSSTLERHQNAGVVAGAVLGGTAATIATRGRYLPGITRHMGQSGRALYKLERSTAMPTEKGAKVISRAHAARSVARSTKIRSQNIGRRAIAPRIAGSATFGALGGGLAGATVGTATGLAATHNKHKKNGFIKSAFGVEHDISKTVLLPKPFTGGKKLKPIKPIQPPKPGMKNANSKNDTTMAGSSSP